MTQTLLNLLSVGLATCWGVSRSTLGGRHDAAMNGDPHNAVHRSSVLYYYMNQYTFCFIYKDVYKENP
jgi:hypothetical protein